MSIHLLHCGRFGRFFVVLLSLFMTLTFDNPLFNDTRKDEKLIMCLAHLLTCITAISLACSEYSTCECTKKEKESSKKDKKLEPEEGKEVATLIKSAKTSKKK